MDRVPPFRTTRRLAGRKQEDNYSQGAEEDVRAAWDARAPSLILNHGEVSGGGEGRGGERRWGGTG